MSESSKAKLSSSSFYSSEEPIVEMFKRVVKPYDELLEPPFFEKSLPNPSAILECVQNNFASDYLAGVMMKRYAQTQEVDSHVKDRLMLHAHKQGLINLTLADIKTPKPISGYVVAEQISRQEALERLKALLIAVEVNVDEGSIKIPTVTRSKSANRLEYVPQLEQFLLKKKLSHRSHVDGQKISKTTAGYIIVLNRIMEILQGNTQMSLRDLFYTCKNFFESQAFSNALVHDVACVLGCTRQSLNIIPMERGCVVGCLRYKKEGDWVDCKSEQRIPDNVADVSDMVAPPQCQFVLLIEDHSTFKRLEANHFCETYPCIIVTGKGQPDAGTRLFLKKIKSDLRLPILALVDCDLEGLRILGTYACGSISMAYDQGLTTPGIFWLGLLPTDLEKYSIPTTHTSLLQDDDDDDKQKQKETMQVDDDGTQKPKETMQVDDDGTQKPKEPKKDKVKELNNLIKHFKDLGKTTWVKEIGYMLTTRREASIQSLSVFGVDYVYKHFLPRKLYEGNFI